MEEALSSGTVGWFSLASAPVGVAHGQTVRVSVANVGPRESVISAGVWQNPRASLLAHESFTLAPGESRGIELRAADLAHEAFDKTGRTHVRAVVSSGERVVLANLEVFDDETGRTGVLLPLQEMKPAR
jgi:hypothetical protein